MRWSWLSFPVSLPLAIVLFAPFAANKLALTAESDTPSPTWTEPQPFRLVLTVDSRGRKRSHSPVAVELDVNGLLGAGRSVDDSTLAVVAVDESGRPRNFDSSRPAADQHRLPHRLDRLFGSDRCTLNFVMPDEASHTYLVYFAVHEPGRKKLGEVADVSFRGLIGDGDLFREAAQRRAIAASHFDQFVDFDGDGDLDLFQGGVEPYVNCWDNVGDNRLVPRGRLANGGALFRLPASGQNRSWMTVAFHDIDRDGDQDFFPSFNDGPDSGRIVPTGISNCLPELSRARCGGSRILELARNRCWPLPNPQPGPADT